MRINGKTSLIGLIGNPVEHTLSPVIHNGISKRIGMNSVYVPFKVEKAGIDAAIKGAYELNILGMNVTVPYKNQIMESLLDVDEAARQIGAVNTLVRVEGGYKGFNTDMSGLRRQMKEDGISLSNETVVILGAGGAAKAVVYMCLLEGAKKIYLLNRTVEKAQGIADTMNKDAAKDVVIPMALQDYKAIKENQLIAFQATSIGLSPHVEDVVLSDMAFYQNVKIGVDLIYNPANTRFMQLVTKAGGRAYNALKMLLYQGVIAYELWHDIHVPQDVIDDIYVELKREVYPKDNIVLIGFMGSGKTTFGKAMAKKLNMDFLDTDDYIEKQAGKSIAKIFEEDGEDYFREIEEKVLIKLRDQVGNTVFSTGGGMPLRVGNARLLKEIGRVYYLTAASQVIFDRVKNDTNRPLLQCEEPYKKVCGLMKERNPIYQSVADVMVDTNSTDIEEVCGKIIKDYQIWQENQ